MTLERTLYESGMTVRQIAALRGGGASSMLNTLRRQGTALRPKGRRPLEADDPKVLRACELRGRGLTLRAIAARMNCGHSQVVRYLRVAGA